MEENSLKDFYFNLMAQAEDGENELCELMDSMDTEALLSAMSVQLLSAPAEQLMGDRFGRHPALLEIIAKNAIPRFGLNIGKPISLFDSNKCYELAEKILNGHMRRGAESGDPSDALNSLSDQLKMHSEIVRGSAYPEQTRKEIDEIQGHFDSWFKSKIGITPYKATEIVFSLVTNMESIINSNIHYFIDSGNKYKNYFEDLKNKSNLNDSEKEFLETFSDARSAGVFGYFSKLNEIVPKLLPIHIENLPTKERTSKQEADALKELIGISKEKINQVTDIQRFPLYILSAGEVILSEVSNCLDVLWDSFEVIAKSDEKFYQRYQKYKSKWLEDQAYIFLNRIFPSLSIYKSLDYQNPDKDGTAELDIAIKWGPFVVLVEAKAKQFRFESMRGDTGRLRSDLKDNIEDAYSQTLRAAKFINTSENPIFTERNTGRKLEINKNSIHKIYPISLSLHHLAGIATQLQKTCELGLFKQGFFPFSICIADLDCILKTNITPVIFLHYIERRLTLLHASEEWLGEELDLFPAYLDFRLDIKNISTDNDQAQTFNILAFGGYSEKFEQLAMYERGEFSENPDFSLNMPEQVLEILQQLQVWDDDYAKFISFALLELDNEILGRLNKAIIDIKYSNIGPGIFRRCSFSNKEIVISVVGSSETSQSELVNRTIYRAQIEKYRRNVNKSIGIGIVCNQNKAKSLFNNMQYIEYEWEENTEFDDLLKNEPAFLPIDKSKIPGRNDPCVCGSGRKFKKCCLNKI